MSQLFAERPDAVKIDYVDFYKSVVRSGCRTLSSTGRPLSGELAWRMKVSLEQFLAFFTYPAWYVAPNGISGASYDAPGAKPILFRDAVKKDDFKATFAGGFMESRGLPKVVDAILLFCSGCGRFVVIDGNHRLAWVAAAEKSATTVNMTCLGGSRWCRELPDMNLVCACADRR